MKWLRIFILVAIMFGALLFPNSCSFYIPFIYTTATNFVPISVDTIGNEPVILGGVYEIKGKESSFISLYLNVSNRNYLFKDWDFVRDYQGADVYRVKVVGGKIFITGNFGSPAKYINWTDRKVEIVSYDSDISNLSGGTIYSVYVDNGITFAVGCVGISESSGYYYVVKGPYPAIWTNGQLYYVNTNIEGQFMDILVSEGKIFAIGFANNKIIMYSNDNITNTNVTIVELATNVSMRKSYSFINPNLMYIQKDSLGNIYAIYPDRDNKYTLWKNGNTVTTFYFSSDQILSYFTIKDNNPIILINQGVKIKEILGEYFYTYTYEIEFNPTAKLIEGTKVLYSFRDKYAVGVLKTNGDYLLIGEGLLDPVIQGYDLNSRAFGCYWYASKPDKIYWYK